MIHHQIIPEDSSIELLNGQLVYRDRFNLVDGVVTLGPHHSYVNCALLDLMKQYIIINLRNRTAEVYANPAAAAGTYAPPQIVAQGQSLALHIGEGEMFQTPLDDLLP